MKATEKIPIPKRRASRVQFPDLERLKCGECLTYHIDHLRAVRAACQWLRREYKLSFVTRVFPAEEQIKVWAKPAEGKK